MAEPMKIRAIHKDGVTEVRIRVGHAMENGQRKAEDGRVIPAWFVTHLTARVGERVVLATEWGPSVARDPILGFKFRGAAKGARLTVTWKDNQGDSRTDEAMIT